MARGFDDGGGEAAQLLWFLFDDFGACRVYFFNYRGVFEEGVVIDEDSNTGLFLDGHPSADRHGRGVHSSSN